MIYIDDKTDISFMESYTTKMPFMDLKYFEIHQEINNPQMYFEDPFSCHTNFRNESVGLLSNFRSKISTFKVSCFERKFGFIGLYIEKKIDENINKW